MKGNRYLIFNKVGTFTIYKKYDDALLASLANEGNIHAEQYLFNRYKKLVKIKANNYYFSGADSEDVIQEGMIGLIKAVRNYNSLSSTSFKTFAEMCIIRQIITAIKKTTRKKRMFLKKCISLNQIRGDTEKYTPIMCEITGCPKANDPMSIFMDKERLLELKLKSNETLSDLESKVLREYLGGQSYKDISFKIKKNIKCVDNAIQRIKKKFEIIAKLN